MLHTSRFRPMRLWIFVLTLAFPACIFSGSDSSESAPAATFIALWPEEFTDSVPCVSADAETPAAMQRYVVTFRDVTPAGADAGNGSADAAAVEPVPLPSSPPVSCFRGAATGSDSTTAASRLTPGRMYDALVEAYDRSDIVAKAPGEPGMVLAGPDGGPTETDVAPRWRFVCNGAPATCVEFRTQYVRGCTPLDGPDAGASGSASDADR
jgi:hypothetical protein